jgi:hypothetical protein
MKPNDQIDLFLSALVVGLAIFGLIYSLSVL